MTFRSLMGAAVLLSGLMAPGRAGAQASDPPAGPHPLSVADLGRAVDPLLPPRPDDTTAITVEQQPLACAGCPVRRRVRPYLESLALNVMYNGINHARGHHTARIGLNSWGANLKHGFEWDVNPWGVNQVGHPIQGSNYFTSGRAHGLSFWEASAVAAFGSATWEFFAENNRASLNDLVNTTLGGITLGEVMHRTAWLVRDPARTGGARRRGELIAAAIDPLSGLARALSGDMSRVSERPSHVVPSGVGMRAAAGVLWQGETFRTARAAARPFVDVDLLYGDVRTGRSRVPFNDFALQLSAGGGSAISRANVRGRLFSEPFTEGKYQLTIFQTFDFIQNRAYAFGGQGVEVEAALTHRLSPRTLLWLAAVGGGTVLGAVDSLLAPAAEGEEPDPVLLNRRIYDYGPGVRFGGVIQMLRDGLEWVTLSYRGYQINVVDGARSNHVLQRLDIDVRVPVTRALALGAGFEYFFRKAYYWTGGTPTDQSPQARMFFVWTAP